MLMSVLDLVIQSNFSDDNFFFLFSVTVHHYAEEK